MKKSDFINQVANLEEMFGQEIEELMYEVTVYDFSDYYVDNLDMFDDVFEIRDLIDFCKLVEDYLDTEEYEDIFFDCDMLDCILRSYVENNGSEALIELLKSSQDDEVFKQFIDEYVLAE